MAATGRLWRVRLAVPRALADRFEPAFAALAPTLTRLNDEDGIAILEALFMTPPDRAAFELNMTVAATAAGMASPPPLTVETVANRDWLRENREHFQPFAIGGFVVHDAEHAPPPGASRPLRIDAATAFGSGRHASTAGCLLALWRLRHRHVRAVLDVGTGTGILAIAAARLWRAPALAVDLDDEAVAVARRNARLNGVAPPVRAARSRGYASPLVRAHAPFDLILANILARPLRRMAKDAARVMAPGGVLVLAGFVARDAPGVLAAHQAVGFHLLQRVRVEDWVTLVLRRRGRPAQVLVNSAVRRGVGPGPARSSGEGASSGVRADAANDREDAPTARNGRPSSILGLTPARARRCRPVPLARRRSRARRRRQASRARPGIHRSGRGRSTGWPAPFR